jgi:hypothetical protein
MASRTRGYDLRKVVFIMLAVAAGLLALGSAAEAHPGGSAGVVGPGGSTSSGGQVTCGSKTKPGDIGPIHLHNNGGGVEACVDSGPVQGRAILGSSPGGALGTIETPDHVTVETDDDTPVLKTDIHVDFPPDL